MRYAIIKDGKVTNVTEAPENWTDPDTTSTTLPSDNAQIGDGYDGKTITPAPHPAASKADLIEAARHAQVALLAKGQMFTVSSGKSVLCDGLASTRADLGLLALYAQANKDGTKMWMDNNGATTTLNADEMIALATLVGNWISDTYPALSELISKINAGDVKTFAEVASYDWPSS